MRENVLQFGDNRLKGGDLGRGPGDYFPRHRDNGLDDPDNGLPRPDHSRFDPDTFLRNGTHFLRI